MADSNASSRQDQEWIHVETNRGKFEIYTAHPVTRFDHGLQVVPREYAECYICTFNLS